MVMNGEDGGVTMGHDDGKTVTGQNHNFYSKFLSSRQI